MFFSTPTTNSSLKPPRFFRRQSVGSPSFPGNTDSRLQHAHPDSPGPSVPSFDAGTGSATFTDAARVSAGVAAALAAWDKDCADTLARPDDFYHCRRCQEQLETTPDFCQVDPGCNIALCQRCSEAVGCLAHPKCVDCDSLKADMACFRCHRAICSSHVRLVDGAMVCRTCHWLSLRESRQPPQRSMKPPRLPHSSSLVSRLDSRRQVAQAERSGHLKQQRTNPSFSQSGFTFQSGATNCQSVQGDLNIYRSEPRPPKPRYRTNFLGLIRVERYLIYVREVGQVFSESEGWVITVVASPLREQPKFRRPDPTKFAALLRRQYSLKESIVFDRVEEACITEQNNSWTPSTLALCDRTPDEMHKIKSRLKYREGLTDHVLYHPCVGLKIRRTQKVLGVVAVDKLTTQQQAVLELLQGKRRDRTAFAAAMSLLGLSQPEVSRLLSEI